MKDSDVNSNFLILTVKVKSVNTFVKGGVNVTIKIILFYFIGDG